MPELGIQNQCIFIAFYASFILLCAATTTSQQIGSLGATVTAHYLCTWCEKKGLRAFFVSSRAAHIHMSKCKGHSGSEVKQISVIMMTRPRDVIAGGSGGMGLCPPPQHQPPGIIKECTWYIPGIYPWRYARYITWRYARYITDIYQIYTILVWYISGIYQIYTKHNHVICQSMT